MTEPTIREKLIKKFGLMDAEEVLALLQEAIKKCLLTPEEIKTELAKWPIGYDGAIKTGAQAQLNAILKVLR